MRTTIFTGTLTELTNFLADILVNKVRSRTTFLYKDMEFGIMGEMNHDDEEFALGFYCEGVHFGGAIDVEFLRELVTEENFDDCVEAMNFRELTSIFGEMKCVSVDEALREEGTFANDFEIGGVYKFARHPFGRMTLTTNFFPPFVAQPTLSGATMKFEEGYVMFEEIK